MSAHSPSRSVIARSVLAAGLIVLSMSFVSRASGTAWDDPQSIAFPAGTQNASPQIYFYGASCASEGNCTGVGSFRNAAGGREAFAVASTNGVWGTAHPAVFASGVQDSAPSALFRTVSCASAGNCTAVGNFRNAVGHDEAFTMTSTNGVWATAEPVAFAAGVQNSTKSDSLYSVSCASASNCTAVGRFRAQSGGYRAFTMTSTNGVWATAEPVAFAAGVENSNPDTMAAAVACASAGNCTAVGSFKNATSDYEAFTMTSTNGVWADAEPVAFPAGVQHANPSDALNALSCVSAGNCTAVGQFRNVIGDGEAFAITSTNGVWGTVQPAVFAAGVQSNSPSPFLSRVSCASAGNCTATGVFVNTTSDYEAFTMSSTNGVWATAARVDFASGIQDASRESSIGSVSCWSAGNCTVAGSFKNPSSDYEAFTMSSTNGVWATARPVVFPAGVQSASPDASLDAVSCVSSGTCVALGRYRDANNVLVGFTMTATIPPANPSPTTVGPTTTIATTTTVASGSSGSDADQLPSTGDNPLMLATVGAMLVAMGFLAARRRHVNG